MGQSTYNAELTERSEYSKKKFSNLRITALESRKGKQVSFLPERTLMRAVRMTAKSAERTFKRGPANDGLGAKLAFERVVHGFFWQVQHLRGFS